MNLPFPIQQCTFDTSSHCECWSGRAYSSSENRVLGEIKILKLDVYRYTVVLVPPSATPRGCCIGCAAWTTSTAGSTSFSGQVRSEALPTGRTCITDSCTSGVGPFEHSEGGTTVQFKRDVSYYGGCRRLVFFPQKRSLPYGDKKINHRPRMVCSP